MKMADGVGLAEGAGELAQGLGHQAGLQADVGVAHLALDLGPGREGGHRVDDDHVERPERISMSAISSACSPCRAGR